MWQKDKLDGNGAAGRDDIEAAHLLQRAPHFEARMTTALQLERVLEALAGQCQTDIGATLCNKLPAAADRSTAENWLHRVGQARYLLACGAAPSLQVRLDIADFLVHAAHGSMLDGVDLAVISQLARCCVRVVAGARKWPDDAADIRQEFSALPDLGLLANLLHDAIDAEGRLLDTASPQLGRLRQEALQIASRIRRRIAELVKETDEQGLLQDDYYTVRDDRYVLPVRMAGKRALGGIIHGSSQTGQTVYVEPPEMVEGNNQLALAQDAVRREERRILAELTEVVASESELLTAAVQGLAALDVLLAKGRLAERLDANPPEFSDGEWRIRSARHPLLVLDGARVVPNDIVMQPPCRWLVISGPNGGGKTVVLTTVGLAVEMARRGLWICAGKDTLLPWFDVVAIVLGDAQDIGRGLSTFEGHLRAVQQAMDDSAKASSGSVLVLLDELANGTEPLAGAALATALLEAWSQLAPGCHGLVTTHYEALKLLPLRDETFSNAALELDAKKLTPTYHLKMGHVGSSSPFELAERIGLSPAIVERARQLGGGAGSAAAVAMERLEALQRDALQRLEQVEEQQLQLDRARALLEDQRRLEKLAADRRIDKAAQEAMTTLAEVQQDIDKARRAMAGGDRKAMNDAAQLLTARQVQVEMLKNEAAGGLSGKPVRQPLAIQQVAPGKAVWHIGLQRVVDVTEVDARGQRVRVRAGAMEVWATLGELRQPLPSDQPGRKPPRPADQPRHQPAPDRTPAENEETLSLRSAERTCDVRGARAEEALVSVDAALDRAMVQNAPGICIVHGMGTGALRSAVQQHLRKHPQVDHFRLGIQGEGGDGVTLVWLKD